MKQDRLLRVDRNVKPSSLNGKSKEYKLDTVRKNTIYNLNDLSIILLEAFKRSYSVLQITPTFMVLIDDAQFGYDPHTRYIGLLKGIGAQSKHFKIELKLIEPSDRYKEILKIINE